eukprot:scaffold1049_cov168-Amphora_coffeaeformis.AAC.17
MEDLAQTSPLSSGFPHNCGNNETWAAKFVVMLGWENHTRAMQHNPHKSKLYLCHFRTTRLCHHRHEKSKLWYKDRGSVKVFTIVETLQGQHRKAKEAELKAGRELTAFEKENQVEAEFVAAINAAKAAMETAMKSAEAEKKERLDAIELEAGEVKDNESRDKEYAHATSAARVMLSRKCPQKISSRPVLKWMPASRRPVRDRISA